MGQDKPVCVFSKMPTAAVLSFQKVIFWTPGDTYIVNIFSIPNLVQNGLELAEIRLFVFSKMAAAIILYFQKVLFWTPDDTPIGAHVYQHTKIVENCPRYAFLCVFQDGSRRHLEFPKK